MLDIIPTKAYYFNIVKRAKKQIIREKRKTEKIKKVLDTNNS